MRITSTILTLLAVGLGRKQGVWALINGGYDCEDARNTLQKWLCSVPTRRFRGARSHRWVRLRLQQRSKGRTRSDARSCPPHSSRHGRSSAVYSGRALGYFSADEAAYCRTMGATTVPMIRTLEPGAILGGLGHQDEAEIFFGEKFHLRIWVYEKLLQDISGGKVQGNDARGRK